MPIEFVLTIIGVVAVLIIGFGILIAKFYKKVDQGQALIVNKVSTVNVSFTGMTVVPIIHRSEVMDISLKTIDVSRNGADGLVCKDNLRADIKVTFFVRVNQTQDDVLKVAQSIGCARASDQRTLEDLFIAKFSEALKTVGKRFDFSSLFTERDDFKDQIIQVIGKDLNGYALEDAAIDYLEQTPLNQMDPANILDAEGIKKITKITTEENVLTNELKQEERKKITAKNVEADEKVFEMERARAEAEANKNRKIAEVQARQQAEVLRVQAEERQRAEEARIQAEQLIAVQEENRMREIEVARKNRERVVAVETERVERERHMEAISRERDVELARISKEKEVEAQKKEIADVIAARVSVEKNVAEEEEKIKDLRAKADAERRKEVVIITAEAEAQESLVKNIKAAEAQEEVAKFEAKQKLIRANADLEASDKEAAAKIRLAEGVQAEQAAEGLARVKVKEADAQAIEKMGAAEAKVKLQMMEAEAEGTEKKGMATVRVHEAQATAIEKKGLAEATVTREQALAKVKGDEEAGLAKVRIEEANAAAIQKKGEAEAAAIQLKLEAEAKGLAEKATAMKALDGVGREHEEFRLELEKSKEVELAAIDTKKDVALAQARILSQAFQTADIQIVGGDGDFFDKFVNAISIGKSFDGAIDHSETLKTVLKPYLSGQESLPGDLKDILQRPAVTSQSLQNLTLSAVLAKVASGKSKDVRGKLDELVKAAKDLGIDQLRS